MADARAFFEEHRDEMLRGVEVLWPEAEPYDALRLERLDNPIAFAAEKQNDPRSADDSPFNEDRFQVLESVKEADWFIFGACDPSLGKSGKRGDYSAIVDVAVNPRTGQMVHVYEDLQRRKPDRIIKDLLAHARDRAKRGSPYAGFAVETNQFQEFFKDELARLSAEDRVYLPIREVHHTSDKVMRVQRLVPDIHNGYLKFLEHLVGGTTWNQLIYFPNADHDDGPDGLEMAVALAKSGRIDPRELEALRKLRIYS